ncbi:MAG: FecR domain-containing protein, partial [Chloroflexota bacterium]
MRGLQRPWLRRAIVSVLFLSGCLPVAFAHAASPPVPVIARRAAPRALRVQVRPGQIKVGRDVALTIRVLDAGGKGLNGAVVAVNGAGTPRIGTTHKGSVTLMVHAMALGKATLLATYRGYAPVTMKLPIVPGSPATVAAITGGMKILAPKQKPKSGKVGVDLFAQYDAVTAAHQFASLGLRDGTLVDLNAGTDVRIQDPLHTRLNQGEVFLEVVHGAASHQIQVGSAVAATKGTRLDVRYNRASHVSTVIVVEGRVQVQNKGKAVLVGAGQQTTVAGTAPPSRPVRVDLVSRLAWLHNLPSSASSVVVPPVLNLPVPPLVPVPPPPIAPTPTMTITSALESTNWSGVVLLDGGVTIPTGSAVTIQPGTVVEFSDSSSISV